MCERTGVLIDYLKSNLHNPIFLELRNQKWINSKIEGITKELLAKQTKLNNLRTEFENVIFIVKDIEGGLLNDSSIFCFKNVIIDKNKGEYIKWVRIYSEYLKQEDHYYFQKSRDLKTTGYCEWAISEIYKKICDNV